MRRDVPDRRRRLHISLAVGVIVIIAAACAYVRELLSREAQIERRCCRRNHGRRRQDLLRLATARHFYLPSED